MQLSSGASSSSPSLAKSMVGGVVAVNFDAMVVSSSLLLLFLCRLDDASVWRECGLAIVPWSNPFITTNAVFVVLPPDFLRAM